MLHYKTVGQIIPNGCPCLTLYLDKQRNVICNNQDLLPWECIQVDPATDTYNKSVNILNDFIFFAPSEVLSTMASKYSVPLLVLLVAFPSLPQGWSSGNTVTTEQIEELMELVREIKDQLDRVEEKTNWLVYATDRLHLRGT